MSSEPYQLDLFGNNDTEASVTDALSEQLQKDVEFCKPLQINRHLLTSEQVQQYVNQPTPSFVHLGGRGDKHSKIMFIAYCPTKEEVDANNPFGGRLGAKLMQAVETYANLDFNTVWCTYLFKYAECPEKISKTQFNIVKDYISREIAQVKPDYIVCLGSDVYRVLTGKEAELDQYCGSPVYYDEYKAKVTLIWSPLSILSMPEDEHNWIIDLRLSLDRHMPNAKSFWQTQDKLPTWRPNSMSELKTAVDAWIDAGVDEIAIDTEFEPRTEWQDHILFKITVSSKIGNLDLHLLEPKLGYTPVSFKYRNVFGVCRGQLDDSYMTKLEKHPKNARYAQSREEVLEYMRITKNDFTGYIGEYKWAWQDGDFQSVAWELSRLTNARKMRVWAQNGRTDYKLLMQMGWNLTPFVYLDIITLAHTLDEHQKYALEALSRKYLGAPSHKFALIEWLHEHPVVGGKLPYSFIPREIIDPYATTDSRRTFDLRDALIAELEHQDEENKVNGYPSIKQGYFHTRMPEFFNLLSMEVLGEPINPYKLVEDIKWYEALHKRLLTDLIKDVKALTGWESFNPDSPVELRKLLFNVLQLTPLYSTGKPQLLWSEVMALPENERVGILPATDGETLRELSGEAPLCRKLYVLSKITTIENGYLRKGAYWSKDIELYTPEEIENFSLQFDSLASKPKKRNTVEAYLAEDMTPAEWEKENAKDKKSKSLSLNINKTGYLYTTYTELLETMRLATRPNMSALPKEEYKDIKKLVGEYPPYDVRTLIEPGFTAEDLSNVHRQCKYEGIQSIVYSTNKASRDWYVIESDWNTGEVWYLVAITGDKTGVDTLSDPTRDVHATMARNMFPKLKEGGYTDMQIKEQFKDLRSAAKPFVFGIPYGRGAASLVAQLNAEIKMEYIDNIAKDPNTPQPRYYTNEEGEHFIRSYAETFKEGWNYLQEQKKRVLEPGYLVSPWGFKRRFPRIPLTSKYLSAYQREASNWQIQHGIGCCRMEASKAYLRVKRSNPKMPLYMLSILHDATKYLVHASIIEEGVEAIHYIMGDGMEFPFTPAVKLRHSMEISDAWMAPQISIADIKAKLYEPVGDLAKVIPTHAYADLIYQSPMLESI